MSPLCYRQGSCGHTKEFKTGHKKAMRGPKKRSVEKKRLFILNEKRSITSICTVFFNQRTLKQTFLRSYSLNEEFKSDEID